MKDLKNKEHFITIRLTKEEKKRIAKMAKVRGMTTSQFIRFQLNNS